MQIKLQNGTSEKLAKGFTRVAFIEKGVERLVYQGEALILEVVTGKLEKISPRKFRIFVRSIVQNAKKHKLEKIAFDFDYASFPKLAEYSEAWALSTLAENLLIANYEFTKYKSKEPKYKLTDVSIFGPSSKEATAGFARGQVVGTYTNICRDIANTPGGDLTPKGLAERAKSVLKGSKAKVTVLDEPAIKKLKMGGLLGVGQGAIDKPRFIIIEYFGKGKSKNEKVKSDDAPVVFVGKGITFDTGGLQVKPGMAMYEMHMDMSGGASVIAAIGAIAKLGLKKNVIGLIPAAENAIGDKSIRPGDVLTMMSGTTVDVLHTDAEGRLVLADALHYARKYNPKLVVDIATLTGAALVAVGQHASIIMTKDRKLEDTFRDLGEESGDYTFPLPLWDEYKQYIEGANADITNIAKGDSRFGGSINGGMFLSHFTKKMKWVHIDMAPRMTSVASDKLAKGATGEPVRLLVKIAESF